MARMTKEEMKQASKDALKEWLDARFIQLGKWSLGAFAAILLAAVTYFILTMNGWHKMESAVDVLKVK